MRRNHLDELLAEVNKIPSIEDLLPKPKKKKKHTLLSKATRKKPKKKKVEEPTLQENFLKQIQNYNDFIVQNDLDAEQINLEHDYDFSAFKTSEDWALESERLADRLSDRKIEIKQNEDAGEFADMELENGVPSHEAVKNMSDEEFKAYEKKYLSDTFRKIDEQIKVDESRPEFADELKEEIIRQDLQRNGEEVPVPKRVQEVEPVVAEPVTINTTVKKPKQKSKPSQLDLKSLAVNSLPYPVKSALDSALEAVNSGNRVINQGEPVNALQDAGRGVMSGLADTAGSVADLGGLVPNKVADMSHDSADWWKDQYEIVDSEAGHIGSNIGTEAVSGLAGGVVGKGIGNAYKGLKLGGETLRKSATKVANEKQKMADDHIDYGHKFLKSIGMPSNITKGKISAADASMVRQNVYENITSKLPHKPLNSGESLASVLSNNIKRNFDSRTMLKRNDVEIESLFKQGIPLDDALRIQQQRLNQIPDTATIAGMLMGVAQ